MASIGAGHRPLGGQERLTDEEQRLERLLLGLRMADGIPENWVDSSRLEQVLHGGLAEHHGGRLALTDRGLFVANEVVLELVGP
jgi:oxygen-independent coproporphyrinogen-3 oxidase